MNGMKTVKGLATLTSLPILAVLAACGGEAAGEASAGGPPFGMPVEVAVARLDTVVDEILSTGEVKAVQYIELRPEIQGRLVGILAPEGSRVGAGRALFKVDDAELRAEVARLEAERDLARQALARAYELLERNASSEADLEQAEASARATQAQLDLQQTRLDRTVVRAPFGGVVGERFVSLGDYLTTSTRLTTLQTVDPQRAVFQVPERYADRLRVGQEVTFGVAAFPGEVFSGVVDFVDPLVKLPGRMITIKARVANPDRKLRAGMFLEARLTTDVRTDAVVVPEDAILPLRGAIYVWIVTDEETASRREVTLGVRTPGFVEIREGLEPGVRVVVGGIERMGEGLPLAPTVVER